MWDTKSAVKDSGGTWRFPLASRGGARLRAGHGIIPRTLLPLWACGHALESAEAGTWADPNGLWSELEDSLRDVINEGQL